MKLRAIVLDCDDMRELALFYADLLGGTLKSFKEEFATVTFPDSEIVYYFQRVEHYTPPTWPERPEKQQQMIHMDYAAADVKRAVERAVACGATVAPVQFMKESTVLLDPAGHPFCICPLR